MQKFCPPAQPPWPEQIAYSTYRVSVCMRMLGCVRVRLSRFRAHFARQEIPMTMKWPWEVRKVRFRLRLRLKVRLRLKLKVRLRLRLKVRLRLRVEATLTISCEDVKLTAVLRLELG